ncbi:M3 family metallopeptidase [[Mycoplasma] collis]|uniref:M3 family metallopeptidase n=1 Tax=[Mycoplasma] collis TaxID=2127 RepID=UPI00051B09A7|nr:M3 family metallopeptidase [[Mycoplasma] collis]
MRFYKKYENIPSKYKFDLESLLKNSIEQEIEFFIIQKKRILNWKETKYDNPENYLKYLKIEQENDLIFNRIYNYLTNKLSLNLIDSKINKLIANLENELNFIYEKNGSELNRQNKYFAKLKKWAKLEIFQNYKKYFEEIFQAQKYRLEEKIENFIIKNEKSEINLENYFEILVNSELDYGYFIKNNKKIKITENNFNFLMSSKDEKQRKEIFYTYYKNKYKHKELMAKFLIDHFNKTANFAKIRNFNSSVESMLIDDKIDSKILENLFQTISQKKNIISKIKKYNNLFFKKKYGFKPKIYDNWLELINIKQKYTIEQAQEIILKALSVMGDEYLEIIKKAFNENWIDYFSAENKVSGAYTISNSYGLDKIYILMNWDYTIDSVFTLVHELGHALHNYYVNKYQEIQNSEFSIFIAEVASTFNELLLLDYLINTNKNKKLKFQMISKYIENFTDIVYHSTFLSNYEYDLFNILDKGQTLSSFDELVEIYQKNEQKFFSKKSKHKENYIHSVDVPHYYADFYLCKYAFGFLIANYFFEKYQEDKNINNYIESFLKLGGSKWTLDILTKAKIDLTKSDLYELAFKKLNSYLNEFIKLGKEIFNKKG